MWIVEIVGVALRALATNLFRATLTALGIIIGVGAVVAMMAMGEGARQAVDDILSQRIDSDLTVNSGSRFDGGWGGRDIPLLLWDYHTLRDQSRYITTLSPIYPGYWNETVGYRDRTLPVKVSSVVADFFSMYDMQVAQGRVLSDLDSRERRYVCVLGSGVARELGVGLRTLGGMIQIKTRDARWFEIVGILAPRGAVRGRSLDDQIYVPLETSTRRIHGDIPIDRIDVKLTDERLLVAAAHDIARVLRRSRQLQPDQKNDFWMMPTTDFAALRRRTDETMTALLIGIAAVSLVVGGIGVMNIMFASVTERTREIGVRKSLGATRTAVLGQFVLEAMILCMTGGVLGIIAGYATAILMSVQGGWATIITARSMGLGFSVSISVGMFFGIYPAWRASRLDPVEALRHE
jgi:putative ABC transport system permease protein